MPPPPFPVTVCFEWSWQCWKLWLTSLSQTTHNTARSREIRTGARSQMSQLFTLHGSLGLDWPEILIASRSLVGHAVCKLVVPQWGCGNLYSHGGATVLFDIFLFICLFSQNTFNILSVLRQGSSSHFTIQTFMNMVCEGILCDEFTAQGTLYNEWWDGSWCICTTGVNVPMAKGWFLSYLFSFTRAFLTFCCLVLCDVVCMFLSSKCLIMRSCVFNIFIVLLYSMDPCLSKIILHF